MDGHLVVSMSALSQSFAHRHLDNVDIVCLRLLWHSEQVNLWK
jgi:hypothetical protein